MDLLSVICQAKRLHAAIDTPVGANQTAQVSSALSWEMLRADKAEFTMEAVQLVLSIKAHHGSGVKRSFAAYLLVRVSNAPIDGEDTINYRVDARVVSTEKAAKNGQSISFAMLLLLCLNLII